MYGRIKRIIRRNNVNRTAPLFPSKYWSVFERIELGIHIIQNFVETWHRWFEILDRTCNVDVYTNIETIKKEQTQMKRRQYVE